MLSWVRCSSPTFCFFFFNDTATTEIYTLSLHDALPIRRPGSACSTTCAWPASIPRASDRKSTRLNSSHANTSYAVFCLKKKNQTRSWATIDKNNNGRIDAEHLLTSL